MANTFNDFFVNVAENIKEPIDPSNHDKLQEYCKEKIPQNVFFDMPLTNTDKILKYLKNLDVRKSTGTDDIGPRLLKMAAPFIAESLTFIGHVGKVLFREKKSISVTFPAIFFIRWRW